MKYFILALLFFTGLNSASAYPRPFFPFYSQGGQDAYVVEYLFDHMRNGIFFDIGAHDGISYSNTYYLEKELGWTGVCVEPNPEHFTALSINRSCICIEGGIFDKTGEREFIKVHGPSDMLSGIAQTYDPRHLERACQEVAQRGGTLELITIATFSFNDICARNGITHIDFLSIDTEGSEERILRSIDFDTYDISVIAVENNFNDPSVRRYLSTKQYTYITTIAGDDIYLKNTFTLP